MDSKIFVGVDISKNHLDLATLYKQEPPVLARISNSLSDINEFLASFKKIYKKHGKNIIFCAENMGIYTKFLAALQSNRK